MSLRLLRAGALAFALAFAAACSDDRAPTTAPESPSLAAGGQQGPDLRAALAAQARHTGRLLRQPDIAGTAVGVREDGQAVVRIYAKHGAARGIPASLDGVPVAVEVTGEFRAVLPRAKPGSGINPKGRFSRPAPIGVSTGNVGECSAGTIGARVKSGSNVYALSNNHVFALENHAPLGSAILQPGRYDTNCASSAADVIGQLAKFEPISFGGDNTVDAAIASTTAANLGNATPGNGYGTPSSTTKAASLNQSVQKYGRTTGLTRGTVTGLNATINVAYTGGTARFVGQIVISGSKGAFSRSGDSGSLIVTNDAAANPVGLLFAGSNTVTIANPIGTVLQKMGVSIDGK